MSALRAIAREAVIFMLLGPVVAAPAVFAFIERRNVEDVKAEAARGVYAIDAVQVPAGFTPVNSVLVPLTNGVKLYVTDCNQAHAIDWFEQHAPNKSANVTKEQTAVRVPPGAHGGDCVYFDEEPWVRYGGHSTSVLLSSPAQIAIEKDYWQAYAKAKSQHRMENAMAAAVLSLWGFPAGLVVWLFYRLVRFAVKG